MPEIYPSINVDISCAVTDTIRETSEKIATLKFQKSQRKRNYKMETPLDQILALKLFWKRLQNVYNTLESQQSKHISYLQSQ